MPLFGSSKKATKKLASSSPGPDVAQSPRGTVSADVPATPTVNLAADAVTTPSLPAKGGSTTYEFESGKPIGLQLADHSSGAVVVVDVVDGTLAKQKGIMTGMTLLAVNGQSVAARKKDDALNLVRSTPAGAARVLAFSNERLPEAGAAGAAPASLATSSDESKAESVPSAVAASSSALSEAISHPGGATTYDFEPGKPIGLALSDKVLNGAIVVTDVVAGSLAQQRGLIIGVALLAVNGEKVAGISKDDALNLIKQIPAGAVRRLTFTAERLAPPSASVLATTYDFDAGKPVGLGLGDHASGAIVVTEVVDGTQAQQKGIMTGMTLLAVNGQSVVGMKKDGALNLVRSTPSGAARRLTFSNERLTEGAAADPVVVTTPAAASLPAASPPVAAAPPASTSITLPAGSPPPASPPPASPFSIKRPADSPPPLASPPPATAPAAAMPPAAAEPIASPPPTVKPPLDSSSTLGVAPSSKRSIRRAFSFGSRSTRAPKTGLSLFGRHPRTEAPAAAPAAAAPAVASPAVAAASSTHSKPVRRAFSFGSRGRASGAQPAAKLDRSPLPRPKPSSIQSPTQSPTPAAPAIDAPTAAVADPASLVSVVKFTLKLAGDVSSFTPSVQAEITYAIAAEAGVQPSAVEIAVTSGSVIVDVSIKTATATATSVQSKMASATSSPSSATAMLASVTGVSCAVIDVTKPATITADQAEEAEEKQTKLAELNSRIDAIAAEDAQIKKAIAETAAAEKAAAETAATEKAAVDKAAADKAAAEKAAAEKAAADKAAADKAAAEKAAAEKAAAEKAAA
jgi:C-terminal processing protease CtpA/Prc